MTIDVIRLAREASQYGESGLLYEVAKRSPLTLERFAALVATALQEEANRKANAGWALMCKKMVDAEREECAKVCDALKDDETQFNAAVEKQLKGNDEARQLHALRMLSNVQLYNAGFIKSAAAIRARKPA